MGASRDKSKGWPERKNAGNSEGKENQPQSEKEDTSVPDSLGPIGNIVSFLVLRSSEKEEHFFPGQRLSL